jgi:hypothetical protein
MIRADYCGTDTPTTRNGMWIDIRDNWGIQHDSPSEGATFEAGWTSDGAVCVNHPRVPENISLHSLVTNCPRLKDAPVGSDCTEEVARQRGAILFNFSK